MSVPTMRQLLPKEMIRPLTELGKHNWIEWWSESTDPRSTGCRTRFPNDPALNSSWIINHIESIASQDAGQYFRYYVLSKALADGPKLIRPTEEQCEALEHVDVNVSFEEYEQPFPIFIAEIPDEYRKQLALRFSEECPRFILTFHDRRSKYIVSLCEHGVSKDGAYTIISPSPCWRTVEDAIQCSIVSGCGIRIVEVLLRITFNLGLLLTRYGAKDCGPVDPAAVQKQQRGALQKNKTKADRAKDLLAATISLIEFEQEVVFFDKAASGEPHPDSDGAMKRPHWRRGHFRRQSCGEGRSQRKLVFVRPCFINAGFFHGELANTSYQINSGSRPKASLSMNPLSQSEASQ